MSSHVRAFNSYINSSRLTPFLSLLVVNIITILWMTTQAHGSRAGQLWLVNFVEVALLRYKVPRRVLRVCQGRKLKCDGSRPSCGNCNRRGYPCVYTPVYDIYLIQDRTPLMCLFPAVRNSKNRHIAILLAGCVCSPHAVLAFVAISFFVSERSAGRFRFFKSYNERILKGKV
jgi:hypothetical protein